MRYEVTLSPSVIAKIEKQADYLAYRASEEIADSFVNGLLDYFDSLDTFPQRGHPRHDAHPGLWVIGYRDSANIAVVVEAPYVFVVGVFFGGEDYENALIEISLDTKTVNYWDDAFSSKVPLKIHDGD